MEYVADALHKYAASRGRAVMLMGPAHLILIYVVVLLGSLILVGIYSEFRRRRFQPTSSEDRIFRCRRCSYVYTDDPDVDRSRCSQCGLMNDAIEF